MSLLRLLGTATLLACSTTLATSTDPQKLRGRTSPVVSDGSASTAATQERTSRALHDGTVVCRISIESTRTSEGSDMDETLCILIKNGKESDRTLPITLPDDIYAENESLIFDGRLVLQLSNAKIIHSGVFPSEDTMYTVLSSEEAAVHYDSLDDHRRVLGDRRLATTGVQTIAMIRISAINANAPLTQQQILSNWVGDSSSVATQYSNCSFGKLQWRPGPYYDIKLKTDVKNFKSKGDMQTAIEAKLKKVAGKDLQYIADKIVFCYPSNSPGAWMASATVNYWRATFNGGWCNTFSGGMHEIGHTIGLLHSSRGGDDYGDTSGMMGYSDGYTGGPKKCFNGYKTWQLGWYQGRTSSVTGAAVVRLGAFVDFDRTATNEPVVVQVDGAYYIQYNRAKSFNYQSDLYPDKVTVTGVLSNGFSVSVAGLGVGESYVNGTTITACSTTTGSAGQDVMVVAINMACP